MTTKLPRTQLDAHTTLATPSLPVSAKTRERRQLAPDDGASKSTRTPGAGRPSRSETRASIIRPVKVIETFAEVGARTAPKRIARMRRCPPSLKYLILLDLQLPDDGGPALVEDIEHDSASGRWSMIVTSFPIMGKIFSTTLPIVDKSDLAEMRAAIARFVARKKSLALKHPTEAALWTAVTSVAAQLPRAPPHSLSPDLQTAGRLRGSTLIYMQRSLLLLLLVLAATVSAQDIPLFTSDFPPAEFAARRAAIIETIGGGVAVLQGAPMPAGYVRFRQNNDFYYLTGIEVPRAYLLIDGDRKTSTIYLPHRNESRERFEGKCASPTENQGKRG